MFRQCRRTGHPPPPPPAPSNDIPTIPHLDLVSSVQSRRGSIVRSMSLCATRIKGIYYDRSIVSWSASGTCTQTRVNTSYATYSLSPRDTAIRAHSSRPAMLNNVRSFVSGRKKKKQCLTNVREIANKQKKGNAVRGPLKRNIR